jgi:hypothetical protein
VRVCCEKLVRAMCESQQRGCMGEREIARE